MPETEVDTFAGIDVSARELSVALRRGKGEDKPTMAKFSNHPSGHKALIAHLLRGGRRHGWRCHCCLCLTDPKKREVLLHLSREKKLNFKRESICQTINRIGLVGVITHRDRHTEILTVRGLDRICHRCVGNRFVAKVICERINCYLPHSRALVPRCKCAGAQAGECQEHFRRGLHVTLTIPYRPSS
jgi:hypothetical protein